MISKMIKKLFAKQYLSWDEFQTKAEIEEMFQFQQECREHNVKMMGTEDENPQPIDFSEAS